MPYRFRLQEPLDDGVRRIAREQLSRALAAFVPGLSVDVAVHGARRRLKKVRTLVRLIRPATGEKTFQRYNGGLRDAGLALAQARDAFVIAATLADLQQNAPVHLRSTFKAVQSALKQRPSVMPVDSGATNVASGIERIRQCLSDLEDFRGDDLSIECLGTGLRQTLDQSRTAFDRARETDDDEDFHEWRKTLQRHYRQLVLLQEAWPELLDVRAQLAWSTASALGSDHDLSMLKTFLRNEAAGFVGDQQAEVIVEFCSSQQARLRAIAKRNGSVLLALSSKAFGKEVVAYWEAAKVERTNRRSSDDGYLYGSGRFRKKSLRDATDGPTD